jgi:GTP-binding protein YchF
MRDLETINMELIFSDMEMVERRIDRTKKAMKGDKTLAGELALFERIYSVLEEGKCARTMALTEDEMACLYDTPLLTMKPVIYVANVSEDDAGAEPVDNAAYMALKEFAASENSAVIAVCAGIESEIAELDGEEKAMFLEDLGISESGLEKLIKASYKILGLMSFLTAGEDECRAWTIKIGTKAPQAAGKIHTDFERGFIKAEVVNYKDLLELGSLAAAREKGLVGMEGKEYVVKDGDVILFRFNV